MTHVIILGGTGLLGGTIHSLLAQQRNLEVASASRGIHTTKFAGQWFSCDRNRDSDLQTLSQAKPWEIVVDLAGFEATHVQKIVRFFPNLKHYVFTSSVSVYRLNRNAQVPFKEEMIDDHLEVSQTTEDIHWKYAVGKWEAENVLRRGNIPYTILRPAMVEDPNDRKERLGWYLEKLRNNLPIPVRNHGQYRFQWVCPQTVGKAVMRSLVSPLARGCTFNVADAEEVSLKDFLSNLAKKNKHNLSLALTEDSTTDFGPLGYDRDWIMDLGRLRSLFNQ